MSDSLKQNQRAGDHSTNLLAQTVEIHQHGLSVSEARQIALDVFKANALELAGIARDLFEARGREFIERYLDELQRRNPEAIESFRDPDMQHVLFTAQRDYARSGDGALFDLLVDLLVERAVQETRDLTQIVLSESIATTSKATIDQCNVLSLIFLVTETHDPAIESREAFIEHLASLYLPFGRNLPDDSTTLQHLQYAGCVMLDSNTPAGLIGKYWRDHKNLFWKPLAREDIAKITDPERLMGILISKSDDDSDYELTPYGDQAITEASIEHGSYLIPLAEIYKRLKADSLTAEELGQYVCDRLPDFAKLVEYWETTQIADAQLTSVGIALAIANIRRKTGEQFDLAQWIK